MNNIILRGTIRDIEYSHTIGNVEYNKANLVVNRHNGDEDIINLKFKKFSNPYKDGDSIELTGNVRSYSRKVSEDKNKVDLYVFTYFDRPEGEVLEEIESNSFEIDGRVCKVNELRHGNSGKQNLHFIIANNMIVDNSTRKLNSYLPCITWGKVAAKASNLKTSDFIKCKGQLHSRTYKKYYKDSSEFELKVAHELLVTDFEVIENA